MTALLHDMVPALVDLDDRLAEHERQRVAAYERSASLREQWERDYQTWQEAHRTALLAGKKTPAQPQPPEGMLTSSDAHVFLAEKSRLENDRKRLIAQHADDLMAALRQREQSILNELRDRIGSIDAVVEDLTVIAETMGGVVRAHNSTLVRTAPDARWQLPRAAVTAATVLVAASDPTGRAIP